MFPKVVTQTNSELVSTPAVPPLEAGACLTRAEFEQRYHAMPSIKKAELIEGVVCMPSPVRYKAHGKPHSEIHGWLFNYVVATPAVELSDNVTLRLDQDNELQPDLVLRFNEAVGGQSRVTPDDYLEGGPELVVEIAASSAQHDLSEKFAVYQRNAVREYIVWTVADSQLHWFWLENGAYTQLSAEPDGLLRSRVFPGLWLDVPALLAGEMARVLQVLQQGLATPEHAEFAAILTRRRSPVSPNQLA